MANRNPSPDTRFKPGRSGNPGGKTQAHRKAEVRAAEIAAKLSLKMVQAIEGKIKEMETADEPDTFAALTAVKADILRLMKDVQDRAFGMPTAPSTIGNPDGTPLPPSTIIIRAAVHDDGDDRTPEEAG